MNFITNQIYSVTLWAELNPSFYVIPEFVQSTDPVSFTASLLLDPTFTFTIDPLFPDAGLYTVALSPGIGNAFAVPEPAMTPFLALLLGGGLARRVFARRCLTPPVPLVSYSAAAARNTPRRLVPKSSARYTTGVVYSVTICASSSPPISVTPSG